MKDSSSQNIFSYFSLFVYKCISIELLQANIHVYSHIFHCLFINVYPVYYILVTKLNFISPQFVYKRK